MSPDHLHDDPDPDDLLDRIAALLDEPDPDPADPADPDPYPWTDAMVWHAPETTHCPVTGKPYLDAAGWAV